MELAKPTGLRFGWLLYPVLLFVAMTCWSISSPPGSSPDEDYHLASVWCAFGTRPGFCTPGTTTQTRVVPYDVGSITCYALRPKVSGACGAHPGQWAETARGNFAGYYPDGFYATMAVFAGDSVERSVLAMRLFNSALYAGGMAALLFLARPGRRENYLLGSLVTVVPLGLFTVTAVNPSSWAITSATLLWASGVEFVQATDRSRRIGLGVLSALALAMAVAARADSAVYGGLAIGLVWFVTTRFGRRTLITGAIVAVVMAVTVAWASTLGSVRQLLALPSLDPATEPPDGWFQRLQVLPSFYLDTFGSTRGLGWLDTVMQPYTWVPAAAVYAMAAFWGLRRCGWRKATSLVAILSASAVVVVGLSTMRQMMPERALQPRYFLPLLVLAAMIALAQDNDEGPQLHLAQAVLIVVALGVAQAGALHTELRRYLTGLDNLTFNLNDNFEWWWSWAPPPMVVLAVGSVAFLGAAMVAAMATTLRGEGPVARRAALPEDNLQA
jgi:hypothetical protein